jgi:DNA segregation ATPase FtsK/SpoIIIE-like protein
MQHMNRLLVLQRGWGASDQKADAAHEQVARIAERLGASDQKADAAHEQAVVPRKPLKEKAPEKQVVREVDDLVDDDVQLTEARRRIASKHGREFTAVERMHERYEKRMMREIDSLVDDGAQLTEALRQVASQRERKFTSVKRMYQRLEHHKRSRKARKQKEARLNPTK